MLPGVMTGKYKYGQIPYDPTSHSSYSMHTYMQIIYGLQDPVICNST